MTAAVRPGGDATGGVWILMLAAGASSRMRGADKLLQPVAGQPLLRRQGLAAVASGLPVVVALPPDRPGRQASLTGLALQAVVVSNASEGMSASLCAGLAAIPPDASGAMIVPADMPEITAEDMQDVAAAFDVHGARHVVRGATVEGNAGHPVLLPQRLFARVAKLRGDRGARELLAKEEILTVALPGRHALTDLDTPEDWAAWRAAQ